MFRICVAAAAISFAVSLPVNAEQFAIQLDVPCDGASAKLMEIMKVSEVEVFINCDWARMKTRRNFLQLFQY